MVSSSERLLKLLLLLLLRTGESALPLSLFLKWFILSPWLVLLHFHPFIIGHLVQVIEPSYRTSDAL